MKEVHIADGSRRGIGGRKPKEVLKPLDWRQVVREHVLKELGPVKGGRVTAAKDKFHEEELVEV